MKYRKINIFWSNGMQRFLFARIIARNMWSFIISHHDKSGSQPKAKPRAYLKQLRMRALWLHHSTSELRNAIFETVLMSKYGCLVTPFRWLNSFSGTNIIIFIINNHALHIWNKLEQQSATGNQDEQFFY